MTFQVLFFISPLLLVAIVHGLCIKYDLIAWLKRPLDFGLTFRARRVFGDNKTWRGLALHVLFCMVGVSLQTWLRGNNLIPAWLPLTDYSENGLLLGLLIGLGMTAGELPNSFLKRQLGITSGARGKGIAGILFSVYDQVDLLIGIWIFTFLVIRPSVLLIIWSLVTMLFLHMMVSMIGYILGMRRTLL